MKFFFSFIQILLGIFSGLCAEEIVWFTWQHDPSTTMVIHWLTPNNQEDDRVEFRKVDSEKWYEATGSHIQVPENNPYYIHSLELTNLDQDTLYEMKRGDQLLKFQTAPSSLLKPVKFIDGGDFYHDAHLEKNEISHNDKMNRVAAALDPLFVIAGGDLAYSRNSLSQKKEDFSRWITWLSSWSRTMKTPSGRSIPMIPVIGNHEVIGRGLQKPFRGKMFYLLFSIPEDEGYRTVDFGNYLSLFLLDSNHTHPVRGDQTKWLAATLKNRANIPYKIASYHVPAYPMHRNYNTETCREIRKYWSPLFENNQLTVAFEHHDHGFKRSHLIRKESVDPTGVLYLGDGAWGVSIPRLPKTNWYLAKALPLRHFFLVTLSQSESKFEAIGEDGKVFDEAIRKNPLNDSRGRP